MNGESGLYENPTRVHGTKSRSLPPYFSRYQTSPGIYIILVRALGRHPILSCFLDRNRPVVTVLLPDSQPCQNRGACFGVSNNRGGHGTRLGGP